MMADLCGKRQPDFTCTEGDCREHPTTFTARQGRDRTAHLRQHGKRLDWYCPRCHAPWEAKRYDDACSHQRICRPDEQPYCFPHVVDLDSRSATEVRAKMRQERKSALAGEDNPWAVWGMPSPKRPKARPLPPSTSSSSQDEEPQASVRDSPAPPPESPDSPQPGPSTVAAAASSSEASTPRASPPSLQPWELARPNVDDVERAFLRLSPADQDGFYRRIQRRRDQSTVSTQADLPPPRQPSPEPEDPEWAHQEDGSLSVAWGAAKVTLWKRREDRQ